MIVKFPTAELMVVGVPMFAVAVAPLLVTAASVSASVNDVRHVVQPISPVADSVMGEVAETANIPFASGIFITLSVDGTGDIENVTLPDAALNPILFPSSTDI